MRPSFATRLNLDLLEENYRRWQENPESVDSGWSAFFEGFELGNTAEAKWRGGRGNARAEVAESPLQTRVDGLVYAYRTLGHTIARVDPLAKSGRKIRSSRLRELGFSEKDLDLQVSSKFFLDNRKDDAARDDRAARGAFMRTPSALSSCTSRIRASAIGCCIGSNRVRRNTRPRTRCKSRCCGRSWKPKLSRPFCTPVTSGRSGFRLQGAESLMVILDTILHMCPGAGIEEICMGMAHRGRLNVLANFLQEIAQSDLHGVHRQTTSRSWSQGTAT